MPRLLEDIARDLAKNKKALKDHEAKAKPLEDTRKELEREFLEAVEAQGDTMRLVALKDGVKVSKEIAVVPQVEDWDAFYAFIRRKSLFHFLERRPSVTACREVWDSHKKIPGVAQFERVSVKVSI